MCNDGVLICEFPVREHKEKILQECKNYKKHCRGSVFCIVKYS